MQMHLHVRQYSPFVVVVLVVVVGAEVAGGRNARVNHEYMGNNVEGSLSVYYSAPFDRITRTSITIPINWHIALRVLIDEGDRKNSSTSSSLQYLR